MGVHCQPRDTQSRHRIKKDVYLKQHAYGAPAWCRGTPMLWKAGFRYVTVQLCWPSKSPMLSGGLISYYLLCNQLLLVPCRISAWLSCEYLEFIARSTSPWVTVLFPCLDIYLWDPLMLVLNITGEMEIPFSWSPVFLIIELGNDTPSGVINSSMCREHSVGGWGFCSNMM